MSDDEFAKLKARLVECRNNEEMLHEILFGWIDRGIDATDGDIESADCYEVVPNTKDPKKPKFIDMIPG